MYCLLTAVYLFYTATVGIFASSDAPPPMDRAAPLLIRQRSTSNSNSNIMNSYSNLTTLTTDRKDQAWFGGKHEDCNTVLYSVPKQGWNTIDNL